jgi:hypothetical protein
MEEKVAGVVRLMPAFARAYYALNDMGDNPVDPLDIWVSVMLPGVWGGYQVSWGFVEPEEPFAEADTLEECLDKALAEIRETIREAEEYRREQAC